MLLEDSAVPPKTVQSGDENRSVSKPIVDAYGKGNKEIFETVCILTRGASKTKSSKDLIMGVTKKILREGDGETFPKKGHRLTMVRVFMVRERKISQKSVVDFFKACHSLIPCIFHF